MQRSVGFTDAALKFSMGSVTLVWFSVRTFHLLFRKWQKCKRVNRKQNEQCTKGEVTPIFTGVST